ncbi:hypothetical protein LguiA_015483 [Lonicera macranthoides]
MRSGNNNNNTRLGQWPSSCILVCLLILAISKGSLASLTILHSAKAKGAVCLDGSAPAFQLDKGFGDGANNWLVHLEGGGWCDSMEDCKARVITCHGSSKRMSKYKLTGILSHNRTYNPNFYNWNRILVHYCDGSSYTGDVEEVDPKYNLYFRGQRVFNAVIEHLLELGMKNATNALLTGCSAGGIGSMLHCDQFRAMLSPTTKVKCVADGGYFIRTKDISGNYFLEGVYDAVVNLHGSAKNLPSSCTSRMKPSLCFFPENALPTVQTPIFIVNSLYDSWQIAINLASNKADTEQLWTHCKYNITDCSQSQIQTLKDFRQDFLRQLKAGVGNNPSRGMFINTCRTHCQTEFQFKWLGDKLSKLNNKAVAEVVGDWFYDRSTFQQIDYEHDIPHECVMNPQEPNPNNMYHWLPWAV